MSLAPYFQEQLRKMNRYHYRHYAQDMVHDAVRSYHYFKHAGNSWNVKPRVQGTMERFTSRLLNAIVDAISYDTPEEELFRLFDALRKAISRYSRYLYKNM